MSVAVLDSAYHLLEEFTSLVFGKTAMLDDVRDSWPQRPDGKRDGLVLFSGDVFSPSVESSVTRGSHMVPVMNAIAPDVSLTGELCLNRMLCAVGANSESNV